MADPGSGYLGHAPVAESSWVEIAEFDSVVAAVEAVASGEVGVVEARFVVP